MFADEIDANQSHRAVDIVAPASMNCNIHKFSSWICGSEIKFVLTGIPSLVMIVTKILLKTRMASIGWIIEMLKGWIIEMLKGKKVETLEGRRGGRLVGWIIEMLKGKKVEML